MNVISGGLGQGSKYDVKWHLTPIMSPNSSAEAKDVAEATFASPCCNSFCTFRTSFGKSFAPFRMAGVKDLRKVTILRQM
jgi:hypothetical protein